MTERFKFGGFSEKSSSFSERLVLQQPDAPGLLSSQVWRESKNFQQSKSLGRIKLAMGTHRTPLGVGNSREFDWGRRVAASSLCVQ